MVDALAKQVPKTILWFSTEVSIQLSNSIAVCHQVPETISQVQLLVGELRRITLLWDELWLGALTQHYTDMARRINQLCVEVARIDANRHLTDTDKDTFVMEKYTVLLRPVGKNIYSELDET